MAKQIPYIGVKDGAIPSYLSTFPASGTWTCPATGWYRFVAWGAGGSVGGNFGGGGSLCIAVRRLTINATVAVVIGEPAVSNTTVAAPGGTLTANSGNSTVGGTASGGDINVNGANGGAGAVVAGASYLEFRGGIGPSTALMTPGGGCSNASSNAGGGLVLIFRQATSKV